MSEIYTRKFGSPSEPPPGYRGSAFCEHTKAQPTEEHAAPEAPSETEGGQRCESVVLRQNRTEPAANTGETLRELLSQLRGKIGTEELILILVLLLIASDGIGPEALILSLALAIG